MNLFVVDRNPEMAAQMLCDKHVVKMTLESAQLMCTALSYYGIVMPYKPTHAYHPVAIWAGATFDNFNWLCRHALALATEYAYRYGKAHASRAVILRAYGFSSVIQKTGLTPFVQAMPKQYQHDDPIVAYRQYYLAEKMGFAKWTRRNVPAWVVAGSKD